MKSNGMSYKEFIEYAEKHYNKGGDAYVECWDKKQFDYFVKNFGEITKRRALQMFKLEFALQKENHFFNLFPSRRGNTGRKEES